MMTNTSELKVEMTDLLLREKVRHLSRGCPPQLLGEAAYEVLLDLKPQLEDALEALAEIERRRGLTAEELAKRRAIRTLLAAAMMLEHGG
jgi:hypothetical protein